MTIGRIELGGIKVFEGRSHLTSICTDCGIALSDICAHLAANRININFMTHISDAAEGGRVTALCTDVVEGFPIYVLLRQNLSSDAMVGLEKDISIVSVFPHAQRLDVAGTLIELVAKGNTRVQGLASSRSAVSMLIPSQDVHAVVDILFDRFEFPSFRSASEWHAAYRGGEHTLKDVVCSYHEEIIKVYDVDSRVALDLWTLSVPVSRLEEFGRSLAALESDKYRIPFLVGQAGFDANCVFALCFASQPQEDSARNLLAHLSKHRAKHWGSVATLSLHGPHFGDRYGIAGAAVDALNRSGITPLAMSCSVSTIAFVIPAVALDTAVQSLQARFDIPSPSIAGAPQ